MFVKQGSPQCLKVCCQNWNALFLLCFIFLRTKLCSTYSPWHFSLSSVFLKIVQTMSLFCLLSFWKWLLSATTVKHIQPIFTTLTVKNRHLTSQTIKNLIHQNASDTHLNSAETSFILNGGYNAETEIDSVEKNKFNNFWTIIILVFLSGVQTFLLKVRYLGLEGNILN